MATLNGTISRRKSPKGRVQRLGSPSIPSRIAVVDLVRSFSIGLVLAIHLNVSTALSPQSDFLQGAWYFLADNGGYGVTFFFVVSGFLITRLIDHQPGGLYRPDLREFYVRRVGRIWPLLFLVVLTGAAFGWFQHEPTNRFVFCLRNPEASYSPGLWISFLTFTFNWYRAFIAHPINHFGLHLDVIWSLAIEEQFYLFYPFLLRRLGSEVNLMRFLAVVIAVGFLSRVAWIAYFPSVRFGGCNSLAGFDLIGIGCLLYLVSKGYRATLDSNPKLSWFLCAVGALFVLRAFNFGDQQNLSRILLGDPFVGWGTFFFLLGGLHLGFFKRPWVDWVGRPGQLSYGLYLLQGSILFLVWDLMGGINDWVAYAIFLATAYAVAWCSYRFYEWPLNRLIRRNLAPSAKVSSVKV